MLYYIAWILFNSANKHLILKSDYSEADDSHSVSILFEILSQYSFRILSKSNKMTTSLGLRCSESLYWVTGQQFK